LWRTCHQIRWLVMLPRRQILDLCSLEILTLLWSRSLMWKQSSQSMAKLWLLCS
jgi:hypothetical protein